MMTRHVILLAMLGALAACGGGNPPVRYNQAGDVASAPPPPLPMPTENAAVVPEGPYPGIAVSAMEATITNPDNGDPAAVESGRQLFVALNCTGCHGFEAKAGLMAPKLTDNFWRYGGSDPDVFNSIYEGRRRGMPAWGTVLSEGQIWQLVAYIRSLGGMTGPRIPTVQNTNTTQANAPTQHNKRQP